MRKESAALGTTLFFFIAPGTLAGYVPWLFTRWHMKPLEPRSLPLKLLGAVLLLASLCVLIESFSRFAIRGLGTPAPPLPTRHLVVSGLYRYVRNPMYLAVAGAIFGQALIFGNTSLLEYGVSVCFGFHLFVLAYEEPTLRERFGPEYLRFCSEVPRWIPQLRPWQGDQTDD